MIEDGIHYSDEGAAELERGYLAGLRAASIKQLREAIRDLGYDDPEAGKAAWIIEREETVAQLRAVCAEHGDNDWTEDLHLGDVIEEHLAPYLESDE